MQADDTAWRRRTAGIIQQSLSLGTQTVHLVLCLFCLGRSRQEFFYLVEEVSNILVFALGMVYVAKITIHLLG